MTSISATRVTSDPTTTAALAKAVLGSDLDLATRVRDVVAGLGDHPSSGLTYTEQAAASAPLLRAVIAGLGLPASRIAADHRVRGQLCDWAMVAAPRLLAVLTGHLDLAVGAITALGDGSDYQRSLLADLDSGAAVGVLALTELAGTNGANQTTSATRDPDTGEFVLDSPGIGSVKFMPNLADPRVPKIVVVTARLIVNGRDEGVLPFLVPLRTTDGLAEGVAVTALPDRIGTPMDHAMITFTGLRLPRQALLSAGLVVIDETGAVSATLPPRDRFRAVLALLGNGRMDLASAAAAAARAAMTGLVNYGRQRRPDGIALLDREMVRTQAAAAIATTYALSAFSARLRELDGADPHRGVLSMLAKAFLPDAAGSVVAMCAARLGAHGLLRINHYPDWVDAVRGVGTAEGETQVMLIAAGRVREVDLTAVYLPGTLDPRTVGAATPWWITMLVDRERVLAAAVRDTIADTAAIGRGGDHAAIALATAAAERIAVTALYAFATATADPMARRLLKTMAAAYALGRIDIHARWFTGHGSMSAQAARSIAADLNRHHAVLAEHLPGLVEAFALPPLPGPVFSADYLSEWETYRQNNTAPTGRPTDICPLGGEDPASPRSTPAACPAPGESTRRSSR
ncbi:acyl-CoA dehydrogenase family protein [Nocardia takedensis]|uniref:acyl-CoA dehydrogenase family protein n=1 Tax=Nocardia takedensis TaxID=259390 RepID=UPI003F7680A8